MKQATASIIQEETRWAQGVIGYLDKDIDIADCEIIRLKRDINVGAYEEQAKSPLQNRLSSAYRSRAEIKQRNDGLCRNPYFAHMSVQFSDENTSTQVFLSDNEELHTSILLSLENAPDAQLVPFLFDKNRPLLQSYFHVYQSKTTDPQTVKTSNDISEYRLSSLRNVDIRNRVLVHVHQLVPQSVEVDYAGEVDELLELRLNENRSDAQLRNIISTLQQHQFEIIHTDLKDSFVVQGCAGSGKTQCLIHRLFFLRDELKNGGWEKVLLLTPSHLFRTYASDLMRRYRLEDVANTSLAEFYCTLLNQYDVRFKNRQYHFELSEEYLPDEYLNRVYAPAEIARIENEISGAISKYVSEGCRLLQIDFPQNCTTDFIERLVSQLEEAIRRFDAQETEFTQDKTYVQWQEKLLAQEKALRAIQTRREGYIRRNATVEESIQKYRQLAQEIANVETEYADWTKKQDKNRNDAKKLLTTAQNHYDRQPAKDSVAQMRHFISLRTVLDLTQTWGSGYQYEQEFIAMYEEMLELVKSNLTDYTKGQSGDSWLRKQGQRTDDIQRNLEKLDDEEADIISQAEVSRQWIEAYIEQRGGTGDQRQVHRSALERARYFLSRIESTIFEQEVWNALAPEKKNHNIQTEIVDVTLDGHTKTTRILYKSDLLFYLKIYGALHTPKNLPQYNFICIDEGQDFHAVDYEMLHTLYPEAPLNVFGDTAQVLHQACGVSHWEGDTGIPKVYHLRTNYRNTAAIVSFCKERFQASMDSYSSKTAAQLPTVLRTRQQLRNAISQGDQVVIVKNKMLFHQMCHNLNLDEKLFAYLDTKAQAPSQNHINCYSIFAAKGLEFSKVVVYADEMTDNQNIVACTRAMAELYYFKEEKE